MQPNQPDLFPLRRPPVRYHGSKWTLAPWLVSLFPKHDIYVEPFAGSASVLLRKPRARVEVYNDLDSNVVNLFRILRNPAAADELIRALNLTPFSREEFFEPRDLDISDLERARLLVFRAYAGFGSHSHNPKNSNGFRWMPAKPYAKEWANLPNALQAVVERLQGVTIENERAEKLIRRLDSGDTLFYLDPPYVHTARQSNQKGYVCEMNDGEHSALGELLHSIKGKAVLSGYPCALYDRLYADWDRAEKKSYASGQVGRSERTEVVWANYELPKIGHL